MGEQKKVLIEQSSKKYKKIRAQGIVLIVTAVLITVIVMVTGRNAYDEVVPSWMVVPLLLMAVGGLGWWFYGTVLSWWHHG